jgi:hypothetical protein
MPQLPLSNQVTAAMDDIRAEVWRDGAGPHWRERLVDQRGLTAQMASLSQIKKGFLDGSEWAARREVPTLSRIFSMAVYHIGFWEEQLEFQRLWIAAASWARLTGRSALAERLANAYGRLYGGQLIYVPQMNRLRPRAAQCS